MPFFFSSALSSHRVLPEQEQTVLSFSQTPALRAITPTRVFSSFCSNFPSPSCWADTTIPRPISSHIGIGLSIRTEPLPSLPTVRDPKIPLGCKAPSLGSAQIAPVDIAPREISPASRTVAQYFPGDKPRMVRSTNVSVGDTCTIRAKPLTLSGTDSECVSRMQTAAPVTGPV
jgi:hypothetical protein